MVKLKKMNYIFCMLLLLSAACKKNDTIGDIPSVTTPVVTNPTPPPVVPAYSKTYDVGTGSGNLVIDGATLTVTGTTLIKVKAGNYQTISVRNFNQDASKLVTIKNNGLVEITSGQSIFSNLNNVVFSGDGTAGITNGFVFRDISYRAIKLDENSTVNNFTFQYVTFKNIGDVAIFHSKNLTYTGAAGSFAENLKFLYINCENTSGLLTSEGSISSGKPMGLIKNLEIGYVTFKNSPGVGTIAYLGNVEDVNIHNNRIDNINTANDNHNGIFMIKGNGSFHDNYVSNHQGNAIRAWTFSIGSTPKDMLIYNNIVVNSRKYSGFEVQSFTEYVIPGVSTYVNAKVFNNTVGNLNLSKDWQGNVVDVYNLFGGKCEVYNNLAYNLFTNGANQASFGGQESSLKPIESNNLYFTSAKEAGITDESSFKLSSNSPAKGKGKSESLSTKDFYGVARSATPSVGAVE